MSRLITKIAEKRDVPISVIANYVRTKLSFILVRSQVMCIRGCRKLWGHNMDILEAEVVIIIHFCLSLYSYKIGTQDNLVTLEKTI